MSATAKPTSRTIAEAAHWAAQLDSERVSPRQRRACEAWCAAHPANRATLERMLAAGARFEQLGPVERDALKRAARRQDQGRLRLGASALALLAVVVVGWAASRILAVRALTPDLRTAPGEQKTLALADGSRLVLDTAGSLDVDLTADRRTVTLFEGQVLATVSPDASRPFTVRSRHGAATALGTAFVVRGAADATVVTVIESTVRVCPRAAAPCLDLGPGQRARLSAAGLTRLPSIEPQAAGAWSKGWLEVDDRPLAEVLGELNRYRAQPIAFDSRTLRGVRVTGSYPLTDTDRAAEALAAAAGLRLTRAPDGRTRIGPGH